MKTAALVLALCALAPAPVAAQPPAAAARVYRRPSRTILSVLEKDLDNRLTKSPGTEPMELLGMTRGLYLEGFGAVFTSEVSLIYTPGLSPFKQSFTKEEVARIHARKEAQLPVLRQAMRDTMHTMADALDVPPGSQIVVGVSLFYLPYEDTSGLPNQIVMRGERQKLLDRKAAGGAIQTEEF